MSRRYKIFGVKAKDNDENTCYYCKCKIDEYSRTKDHLVPKSKGGQLANRNKVWACGDCNKLKGHLDPYEFREALYMLIRATKTESEKQVSRYRRMIQSINTLFDERREERQQNSESTESSTS